MVLNSSACFLTLSPPQPPLYLVLYIQDAGGFKAAVFSCFRSRSAHLWRPRPPGDGTPIQRPPWLLPPKAPRAVVMGNHVPGTADTGGLSTRDGSEPWGGHR